MESERIQRTASVIDTIIKIARGFALAGAIVCAVFIPLMLIFGEKMLTDTGDIYLGGLALKLAGDPAATVDMGRLVASVCVVLGMGVISCMFVWFLLGSLRKILAPMKEGRPFEAGVSERIRNLGWTVLIGGVVSEIAGGIARAVEFRAYDLTKLFTPAVEKVELSGGISLWGVVGAALIIFFLAYVFRHGETLQRESDETL